MLGISHLSLGYLVFFALNKIFPSIILNKPVLIVSAFIFSMLPDFTGIFYNKIRDHHKDFFHVPLFWLIISLFIFLLSFICMKSFLITISALLFFETQFHLLFDFITGRTIGVRFLYPFIKKEYSLFPINRSRGNIDLRFPKFNKEQNEYLKFYLQNKFLTSIEVLIIILGVIVFLVNV